MLEVINLSKIFYIKINGSKEVVGCQDINFKVNKGEFLSILGPSGVGKSTILKCIYRTYIPTSGDIYYESLLFGKLNIAKISDRTMIALREKEIGYVSQFLRVIPRVTAIDLVIEPIMKKNGISYKEARDIAEELLFKLKIPKYLFDAYPSTFSGGEQQKVNIARGVIWKPRVLLLDEPTASLDIESTKIVIDLLMTLKEEGTTIVAIFHDEKLASLVSDKILRISGRSI
ncbi:MAG: ATP-binding cassette domain-containing protein [Caldimicrobium sp.]|nr:ATP-binding cassette domain-containing protein [Caldimicrobium sp.]MCX7874239.1 ATP-binding cassette domain-containing protein [Caldimicrobium sp.]MDW8094768.1 ATP-binding cassette domain-containing protein [Caldimicrobium sp.]